MLKKGKRVVASLLAAVLLVGQLGATVYAEGPPSDAGGLCEHHAAHDDTCGYVEAIPGRDCEHEHTPECYTDQLICGLDEGAEQTATDSDAGHRHGQECYALDCPHERGEHDEACGYIECVAGTPCGYVCDVCNKEPDKDSGTTSGNTPAPVEPEPGTGEPEDAGTITVTAFDELNEAVKYQTVPAGTRLDGLTLPATLGMSGYAAADDTEPAPEPITITGVTWEPDSPWDDTAEQGGYIFTPVLPAGYARADGVELPEINVLIGGAAVTLDAQGDVLTVTFDSNDNSSMSSGNDMATAIDAALAALPPDSYKNITTIKLTGGADKITGYNWRYLIELYSYNSDWDSLTALDLSGMAGLTAVSDNVSGGTYSRPQLRTLTLPDSLKKIGEVAFYSCENLTLTELPKGVTQIGDSAFDDCTSITLTELPKGVTQIGSGAFYNCTGITLTELPKGVTQIGTFAFSGCTGITLNELPGGLTEIGAYAFSGCTGITLNELPGGLTQIGAYAFYGCTGITLNELPEGVTQIGEAAFYGCTGITLNELPKGMIQIWAYTFYDCTGITLLSLPSGVTEIREHAFEGCTGITHIIMEPQTAPMLEAGVFSNTSPDLKIYIPSDGNGYDIWSWGSLTTVKYTPITSISLSKTALTLTRGGIETLTATLSPDSATFKDIIWESSDTNIVTVDQNGNVNAVSNGTATITATSRQGRKTATCAVTVETDSSGNSNGGGDGGGDNRNYIITTPQPPKPNTPVLAVIELPVTVGDGTATGKPDDGRTAAAIAEAGNKAGAKQNGIAVQYDAKTSKTYDGFSISLQRATLDRLIDAKVKYVTLNTGIVDLTFDLAALKEIAAKSTGDITLTAARETGLAGDALAAVGKRPAYRLNVSYTGKDDKAATVDSFGAGRVTVGLAYAPAVTEQAGSLCLVYSKDGKDVEWLYSIYDRTSGNVIASVGHFSVYAVGHRPAPAFTDTVNHWAKPDIDFVASRGLLTGTGETTFTPDGTITRGMFVTALGRLAGVDPTAYTSSRFTDVAADAYYAPYVEWAASKGIVNGTGEKTFSPDSTITREQMAAIMQRYADKLGCTLPVAREADIFADEGQITSGMKNAVQAIQQAGIMNGKGGHHFGPKDTATRAEAAVLRRFAEFVIDRATAGGWGQNDAGKWLYYEDAKPVTDWKQIDSKWYYFDSSGLMQAGGWREIGGKWYYFYPDGAMAVNTKIDGYEIGSDGARKE
jgi:hypothetical protein